VPIFHPELLEKVVKTSLAEFLGAMTKTGMMMTRKPSKCPNSDSVSNIGSELAPHVLNTIVTARKASMRRVYCQFGNAKSSLPTATIDSIRVVHTNTELAVLASQPKVLIHPLA